VPTVIVTGDATPRDEVLICPYVADGVLFLCERLNMTETQHTNVGIHYLNFITLNSTRSPECDSNCNACCVCILFVPCIHSYYIYIRTIYTCFFSMNCDVNMPS
jgi:hypothetical protein